MAMYKVGQEIGMRETRREEGEKEKDMEQRDL